MAAANSSSVFSKAGAPLIIFPSWEIGTLPVASRVAIPSGFPTAESRTYVSAAVEDSADTALST